MFTVGRFARSSSACRQLASRAHLFTPRLCFAVCSLMPPSGDVEHCLLGLRRAAARHPGSRRSPDHLARRPACAAPGRGARRGCRCRARLLECTSFEGPRPHFSPLETSSSSTTPLAPSEIGDGAVAALRSLRHEDALALRERLAHRRRVHHLREMRRADLLFALGHQHEVDGQLPAGAVNRVQRRQECGLRTLLVDRAAAHDRAPEVGQVDDLRVPGRRGPFRGVGLLHVVHEVHADRAARTGIERREHAGLAVGGAALDVLESRIGEHPHCELAAFLDAAVLRGDRRLADPFLQACDGLVVAALDFLVNGSQAARRRRGPPRSRRPRRPWRPRTRGG